MDANEVRIISQYHGRTEFQERITNKACRGEGPHITHVLYLKTEPLVSKALAFTSIIPPFSPTWGPNAAPPLIFQAAPQLPREQEIQCPPLCPIITLNCLRMPRVYGLKI